MDSQGFIPVPSWLQGNDLGNFKMFLGTPSQRNNCKFVDGNLWVKAQVWYLYLLDHSSQYREIIAGVFADSYHTMSPYLGRIQLIDIGNVPGSTVVCLNHHARPDVPRHVPTGQSALGKRSTRTRNAPDEVPNSDTPAHDPRRNNIPPVVPQNVVLQNNDAVVIVIFCPKISDWGGRHSKSEVHGLTNDGDKTRLCAFLSLNSMTPRVRSFWEKYGDNDSLTAAWYDKIDAHNVQDLHPDICQGDVETILAQEGQKYHKGLPFWKKFVQENKNLIEEISPFSPRYFTVLPQNIIDLSLIFREVINAQ